MPRKNRYKPRKDGRYYTLVGTGEYDDTGRPIRIPLYADSSKELENKVDELKAQIKSGKYTVKCTDNFETYANKFVELYKGKREYNTQRMYRSILDTYLIPAFGNRKVSEIKKTDIQQLINDNADHPRTCEQIEIVLKQILSSAVDDHYITESPWRKIELPKYTPPKRRILTTVEEHALNTAVLDPDEHLLVMLFFGCGLRLEENIALQVQDIDLQNEEVVIHHTIIFKNNQPIMKPVPKSPNGYRRIPVPAFLIDELRFYVLKLKKAQGMDAHLFQYKGRPYTKSHFYDAWSVIIQKLNASVGTDDEPQPINNLTSRVFRYNYATILYYSGITLKKAVELMGHSDEKMILKVYAQLDEERENAKKKLADIRPGMARTRIS